MRIILTTHWLAIGLNSGTTIDRAPERLDPGRVIAFRVALAGLREELDRVGAMPVDVYADCPPDFIDTSAGVVYPRAGGPFAQGGSSEVRSAGTMGTGRIWVVKTLTRIRREAFDEMMTDMAYCSVFHADGVAPEVAHIDPASTIDPHCRVRTMISAFKGMHQPRDFMDSLRRDPTLPRPRLAAMMIARALELLRTVHEGGVVHGDIHLDNVVCSDRDRVVETMALIDFGRATEFIEDDGSHKPEAVGGYGDQWSTELLSPWELEGVAKSRRDDIFRLAEMAITLLGMDTLAHRYAVSKISRDPDLPRQRARMAGLKRGRDLGSRRVPTVFRNFYRYALGMGFQDQPDYGAWILAFNEFFPEPELGIWDYLTMVLDYLHGGFLR